MCMVGARGVQHHSTVRCTGTGLGGVFLTWSDAAGRYDAHPSEGGMAEFQAR